ncbi:hypothetical protein Nepgr_002738 [Nepenthes gracilis]|uniref:Uncharacterized protein n=1 Tax=Nepenthes gracilis TaxID=150966 RepID=A0AAD3P6V4_NEPGR|nr:hypothetical protein Nepgr_002738 [Nepenthes gracilis]
MCCKYGESKGNLTAGKTPSTNHARAFLRKIRYSRRCWEKWSERRGCRTGRDATPVDERWWDGSATGGTRGPATPVIRHSTAAVGQ